QSITPALYVLTFVLFVVFIRPQPTSTLFPYTTLFRSGMEGAKVLVEPVVFVVATELREAVRDDGFFLGDDIPPDPATGQLQLPRSEEHTSELQSRGHLVCRLLLEKKKTIVMFPDAGYA